MRKKKLSQHRTFNGKRLRLTGIIEHAILYKKGVFRLQPLKRAAVIQLKGLRREGYHARMVCSRNFGYLIYSNKPLTRPVQQPSILSGITQSLKSLIKGTKR